MTWDRPAIVLDNETGLPEIDDVAGVPAIAQNFSWLATDRDEVDELRGFLDTVAGRQATFLCPTYQQDLVLAEAAGSADDEIVVTWCGFADLAAMAPGGAGYLLAFIRPGEANIYRQVTGAADNLDGTETIELDDTLGDDLPLATLICLVLAYRLDEDETEITWHSTAVAEASFRLREIPHLISPAV